MNCTNFRQHIDDYIDNNLSDAVRNEMHRHMTECGECKKELKDMQKIIECMNTMPEIPVPDDFLDKLNKRIDETTVTSSAVRGFNRRKIFNYRTYSAAAACILLFVMVKADIPKMLSYGKLGGGNEQSITSVLPNENVDKSDAQANADLSEASEASQQAGSLSAPDISATDTPDNTGKSAKSVSKQATRSSDTDVEKSEKSELSYPETVSDTSSAVLPTDGQTAKGTFTPEQSAYPTAAGTAPTQTADAKTNVAAQESLSENAVAVYGLDGENSAEQGTADSGTAYKDTPSVQNTGRSAKGGGTAVKMPNTAFTFTLDNSYRQSVSDILDGVGAVYNGQCYVLRTDKTSALFAMLDENGIVYTYSAEQGNDGDFSDIYLIFD